MEIKSVAVLGAGAVGSYIIQGLAKKPGISLGVVATGERAKRLGQGCKINNKIYHPQVWSPKEAHNVDLLVVALKYGALAGALEDIKTIAGENTTVISLMNGVDSEDTIASIIGQEKLLYSLIKIASHKEQDEYVFDVESTIGIILGELQAPFASDRVKAIEELFAETNIHYRVTEHIREEIWSKFRLNVTNLLAKPCAASWRPLLPLRELIFLWRKKPLPRAVQCHQQLDILLCRIWMLADIQKFICSQGP